MGERRHRNPETATAGAEPQDAATLQQQYEELQRQQDAELRRLRELGQLEQERDLSFEELQARLVLVPRTEARLARLESARLDAAEAEEAQRIVDIVPQWEEARARKLQAWQAFFTTIADLQRAWGAVLDVHGRQEEIWSDLPRAVLGSAEFLGRYEMARNTTGRMEPHVAAWSALLAGVTPLQVPDAQSVVDADPGMHPLNLSYIERRKREAADARRAMARGET
jgi:hypothetical protein